MGIKNIHLVLIIVSILFSFGFGWWNMNHDYALWGYLSVIVGAGLLVYCTQFIKKMKVL